MRDYPHFFVVQKDLVFFLWFHGVPNHVGDEQGAECEKRDGEFGIVFLDDVLLTMGEVSEKCENAVPDGCPECRVKRERKQLHFGKPCRNGNQLANDGD